MTIKRHKRARKNLPLETSKNLKKSVSTPACQLQLPNEELLAFFCKTFILYTLTFFLSCLQTFDINALLKLDQDLSAEVSKVSCADESVLCNTMSKSQGVDNQGRIIIDLGSILVQEPVKVIAVVKQTKQNKQETKPQYKLMKQGQNIIGSCTEVSPKVESFKIYLHKCKYQAIIAFRNAVYQG